MGSSSLLPSTILRSLSFDNYFGCDPDDCSEPRPRYDARINRSHINAPDAEPSNLFLGYEAIRKLFASIVIGFFLVSALAAQSLRDRAKREGGSATTTMVLSV